jgi:hypothetical protein
VPPGPPEGRYLVRSSADAELEAVLVLGGVLATVVRPEPFASREHAELWLEQLRDDDDALHAELLSALAIVNRALRAQRLARADPFVAELSAAAPLVVRVGYGEGEALADGRFADAVELPRGRKRKVKRSMESPEERFAALLGGREAPLVAEELVLRARADLDGGRPREAALQARVGLEALLAERPDSDVTGFRDAVGAAANAALEGSLSAPEAEALTEALKAMEAELRRYRLGG